MIPFLFAAATTGAAFVLGIILGWQRARAAEVEALRRLRVRLLGVRGPGQAATIIDTELVRLGALQPEGPHP